MYIPHVTQLGKKVKIIQPGEYHVSAEDEMIGTLLGSCVAVCLHDPEARVSGMNHFMLPGRIVKADIFRDRTARYGITAMVELMAQMERAGAARENLTAKVFGGGHVIVTAFETSTLPSDNIRLARVMLELEDIPIDEMNVGGSYGRKILMEAKTGRVYLKNLSRKTIEETLKGREYKHMWELVPA
jgi:chemotaxis protein CheD